MIPHVKQSDFNLYVHNTTWLLVVNRYELTFPSKISCFLLFISFFSSKSVDSSFYKTEKELPYRPNITSISTSMTREGCLIFRCQFQFRNKSIIDTVLNSVNTDLTPGGEVIMNMRRRVIRTISHCRLVTLTWVRICRTSFSSTGNSFSFVSAQTHNGPVFCLIQLLLEALLKPSNLSWSDLFKALSGACGWQRSCNCICLWPETWSHNNNQPPNVEWCPN